MSPGLRWPQAGHAGAALAPLEDPSTRTMPFHLPSSQHKPLHFCKGITKRRPRKIHGASSACQIKWQQLCAHKGFSEGHRHSLQPGAAHSLTSALSHLRQGPGCGHHHLHAHTHCPSSPIAWGHCLGTDTSAASRGPGDLLPRCVHTPAHTSMAPLPEPACLRAVR